MAKKRRAQLIVPMVAFGVFTLPMGFLFTTFGRSVWNAWEARSWEEVPCVIASSQVDSSAGDLEDYSIAVEYLYAYDGMQYRSDRYAFLKEFSEDFAKKKKLSERLSAGTETTCYVNPDRPSEAVLVREIDLGGAAIVMTVSGGILLFCLFMVGGHARQLWRLAHPLEAGSSGA